MSSNNKGKGKERLDPAISDPQSSRHIGSPVDESQQALGSQPWRSPPKSSPDSSEPGDSPNSGVTLISDSSAISDSGEVGPAGSSNSPDDIGNLTRILHPLDPLVLNVVAALARYFG
ncbi:hypothetical protein ACMFMF_010254 [Clarireedia jacksonii]